MLTDTRLECEYVYLLKLVWNDDNLGMRSSEHWLA